MSPVIEVDAHRLTETRLCRMPNCTSEATTAAVRGPYANLCDIHKRAVARDLKAKGIYKNRRPPKQATDLQSAARALAPAATRLERAVAGRREASQEAKQALADFNDALNAVKAAAEALIR